MHTVAHPGASRPLLWPRRRGRADLLCNHPAAFSSPVHTRTTARCSSDAAGGCSPDLMLQRAKQFYEEAWSQPRGLLLLDDIMAPDHQQVDQVWQQQRPNSSSGSSSSSGGVGEGRRRMKRGILAYRAAYPDIKFEVQSSAAVPGKAEVFVYWTASGTNSGPIREQPASGKRVQFSGVTLMRFNAAGQIQQSIVFREAPEDEARYFLAKQA